VFIIDATPLMTDVVSRNTPAPRPVPGRDGSTLPDWWDALDAWARNTHAVRELRRRGIVVGDLNALHVPWYPEGFQSVWSGFAHGAAITRIALNEDGTRVIVQELSPEEGIVSRCGHQLFYRGDYDLDDAGWLRHFGQPRLCDACRDRAWNARSDMLEYHTILSPSGREA